MNSFGKSQVASLLFILCVAATQAEMVVTPWVPIFKGVDRAVGTNFPTTTFVNNGVFYTDSTLQVAHCVRVDLTDPDVQLFPTPRATNYIANSSETYSISVSNFIKRYNVQVASAANFYNTSQGNDPTVEGIPAQVYGLSISTGAVVSVTDTGPDSNNRWTSMLFTTNKVPSMVLRNIPPGTNTTGIYTAFSGYYPVLTNGVIIGGAALTAAFPDPTFHQLQPRTVFGLSADRRYFYMMIIDGRQPGYSDGANDDHMGIWLLQFGASDGIAMDGGGSTAMYMADCSGNPQPLGRSSYIAGRGRERITGSQLGIRALPLNGFVNEIKATPGSLTASVSWTTISNATTQVEYGLTPSLGTLSALDSTPVTNHTVTLSGLKPATRYYFRVLSSYGGVQYSSSCASFSFSTTNFAGGTLVPMTATWRYQTANLDGTGWQTRGYNDVSWPSGPAAMWADSRNQVPANSTNVIPNFASGTRMPINTATSPSYPFTTYYLRTQFTYSNSLDDVTLLFSNYLDDGAVFYLNGFEINRINMPAGNISNGTFTPAGAPCSDGNASCPLLFSLTGNALSNLVVGTNILAVEVHNYRSLANLNPSPDITFESAVSYSLPPPAPIIPFFTNVIVAANETNAVFTWTTLSNSTSQILYGTTPSLGISNALDSTLVSNHAMVLGSLQPSTLYYFRLISTIGTNRYTEDGSFTTTSFLVPLVTFSNSWRFTTNNLDGVPWTAVDYDDSGWLGQGPALLYVEDNVGVSPRNTPLAEVNGAVSPTCYFRTHFTVNEAPPGLALLFTNYIDDGAVFHLNGMEIQRIRMPAAPLSVSYWTLANGCPINSCEATADVPDVFRLSGDALTNLVVGGDNVLAAEVHQITTNDLDVVFGSSVSLVRALVTETPLHISRSTNSVCISWVGEGFTLQRANILTGTNVWTDVPGGIRTSPFCTTNPASTTFYRLRP